MTSSQRWIFAVALTSVLLYGLGWMYFDGRPTNDNSLMAGTPETGNTSSDSFAPLPLTLPLDARKVALGQRLFNEPRLSSDGSVSCVHCHKLNMGGVDRLAHSRGVGGKEGDFNTPTVFNSGFNFRQFWDGRAETLEEQIDGPLQHPLEMANTWPMAVDAITADPHYAAEFTALYQGGITPPHVKDAIATFLRSLITPNSRFDRYLRGNQTALNHEELAGYRLFKQIGCSSCHQGLNIGGNMYQKLGIMVDYFAINGAQSEADQGRFNVTKQEEDRHYFRVPSLRNVALTPPYLHNGSAQTLEEAVKVMARYQLGKELDSSDVIRIVAFLRTLTGEYLGQPLE